ncbi:MAG TPA: AIR synthase-related protein [Spirochaetia bacterium]|nr:AIR synthase-related protein [Spirochaetia bacterium]
MSGAVRRLEVSSRAGFPDGRARRLLPSLQRALSGSISHVAIVDVFVVRGVPGLGPETAREVFADEVSQVVSMSGAASAEAESPGWDCLVEVTVKPGVTDPVAITALEALRLILPGGLPPGAQVQTGTQYLFTTRPGAVLDLGDLAAFLANPLIQTTFCLTRAEWESGKRPPAEYPSITAAAAPSVETIDLAGLADADLEALSRRRLLALSTVEMRAVQEYFGRENVRRERRARGLSEAPTDVELEMIAQTWSEHCKHKIFNATIRFRENGGEEQVIRSLFRTFIRATTETIRRRRRDLRSVFHDNAGVVAFDRRTLLCFKVETHNSPSALDPYGGAITGIVGVNRDILGTGQAARPLFNTDVLCFADPRTPAADVPAGLMHPRRVMEGVHRGIVDGGNQSGIPVVAGAFLFDDSFLGKPLVFCGTGGVLPARTARGRRGWKKAVRPGDVAVMAGGRVGKDGIHGATFSSEALSESSPTSAVQIGDPITQKRMVDMILEARDLGLFRGITDNGAGGLSSSLGEMASLSGGVRIDLDACPLKYQGLAPWEILVSESQERMSLAVPPRKVDAFISLAARRGVEASVVGQFTDTGFVEVHDGEKLVGLIGLDFLHDGLPVMELRAQWTPAARQDTGLPPEPELGRYLSAVLSEPNVASKETLVRQYDHEVQGRSVVKPFVGRRRDAPSDGGVLRVRAGSRRGITVTHGICPWYGDQDGRDMALCAVDEAVRAHVALGGDPRRMSALDNFCWPDPVEGPGTPDGAQKLGQLVRTCRGLAEACVAYQLPLISGKDSMKNDARVAGRTISIRPTLLVSLMGIIPDVSRALSTDFKAPGDLVCLIGETRGELGGSRLEKLSGRPRGKAPSVRLPEAKKVYGRVFEAARRGILRSCHDLSDGGLWAALAESCIGGDCGVRVDLELVPASAGCGREPARLLFCETPSRFLVSIAPENRGRLSRLLSDSAWAVIGEVARDGLIAVTEKERPVASLSLEEARDAWKGGQWA